MILNIQALRAVAALFVVFVHLDSLLGTLDLSPFGYGGVDLFFVISGFVMVYVTKNRETSPITFFLDRIIRIAPLYWVMTLFVFVIAWAMPSLVQSSTADILDLIKSIFFIPFEKSNGLIAPTLFVGWTLNYEMFFYALFSLGLAFPKHRIGLAVTAFAIVALVAVGLVFESENVFFRFYTNPIMLEFVFGMALALLADSFPQRAGFASKIIVAVVAVAALAAVVLLPMFSSQSNVLTAGAPAVIVVICAVALERWGWRIESKAWLAVGAASYALYLTHPFVTQVAQKFGLGLATNPAMSVVLILTTLVGVVAVAVITHRALEAPMLHLLRRALPGRRDRATS